MAAPKIRIDTGDKFSAEYENIHPQNPIWYGRMDGMDNLQSVTEFAVSSEPNRPRIHRRACRAGEYLRDELKYKSETD